MPPGPAPLGLAVPDQQQLTHGGTLAAGRAGAALAGRGDAAPGWRPPEGVAGALDLARHQPKSGPDGITVRISLRWLFHGRHPATVA
jgi:hypothetical protein